MAGEPDFQLVVVAIDDYATLGTLPSSTSADTLEKRLSEWSTIAPRRATKTNAQEIRQTLREWTLDRDAASSSFVYWAGHGWDDGDRHFLLTSESEIFPDSANSIPAADLAGFLQQDWARREGSGDPQAWTVAVLDCCGAAVGVTNIENELTRQYARRPKRYFLLPVAEEGLSFAGRFVEKLGEALDALTVNDSRVALRELLFAVVDRLGGDVQPEGSLPASAVLVRAEPAGGVVTANLEALAELDRRLDEVPAPLRAHFFSKAAGADAGEPAWYFSGRAAEVERLATWLQERPSGALVVTGEPGAGKSAILGYLVTLADPVLLDALQRAGLIGGVSAASLPPEGTFDVVLHLTGMTDADCLRAIAATLEVVDWRTGLEAAQAQRAAAGSRFTVLADALDEAQEPLAIAKTLRRLSNLSGVRVVVGSRRSLGEALGAPPTGDGELLRALGASEETADVLVVKRDRSAVEEYVKQRLSAPRSPYRDRPASVDALARMIGEREEPFLYARLASGELLERPPFEADDPELPELLTGDYLTLFAAAVDRLSSADPKTRALLNALAWARGRGLPRAGGVWATVAVSLQEQTGVAPGLAIGEDVLDRVLVDAAPYIVLDGEMGQSTYRLAHQTFGEHLRRVYDSEVEPDVAIAAGLEATIATYGGWETANPYPVRYLPQHLASDPGGLEALVGSIDYLRRALDVLGVDALVDLLAEASETSGSHSLAVLALAVRRSRVALSRDPSQLRAQLYARLLNEDEPVFRHLLVETAESGSPPWLRGRTSTLGWSNDLDTVQTLRAKARAVSFGQIGGEPTFAIGAGTSVYFWNPLSATFEELPPLPFRVTAVAAGTVDGTPLAVAVGGYDGRLMVFDVDARAWHDTDLRPDASIQSVCLTAFRGRGAVAAATGAGVHVWDYRTSELLFERDMPAQAIADTRLGLVAASVSEQGCWVHEVVSDVPVGPFEGFQPPWQIRRWHSPDSRPPLLAMGQAGGVPLIAVAHQSWGTAFVLTLQAATIVAKKVEFDFPVRSLAIGEFDGRIVLAAVNETDEEDGFVIVREAGEDPGAGAERRPVRHAVLGVGRTDERIVALVSVEGAVDTTTGRLAGGEVESAALSELLTGTPNAHADEFPHYKDGQDFRIDRHDDWPETVRAYGVINGRRVLVRGSFDGMAVLLDAATKEVLAAGPHELPHTIRMGIKPPSPPVTGIAIGSTDAGPAIALACNGLVTLRDAHTFEVLPIDWLRAVSVTSVALGTVDDAPVLGTGGKGGGMAVWDLHRQRRIAGITLDCGLNGLWIISEDKLLVARTVDGTFHVFEIITG